MVYGNIYDPAWREQQLLKELNIPGVDDDENNPDYTADGGENTDGAEGGGQQETEPPAEPDAARLRPDACHLPGPEGRCPPRRRAGHRAGQEGSEGP